MKKPIKMTAGLCTLLMLSTNLPAYAAVPVQAYENPVIETETVSQMEEADEEVQYEDITKGDIEVLYEDIAETPVIEDEEERIDAMKNFGGYVNVRSHLNIRSGAGREYEVIGHLLPGDEVRIVGENGDWYEIAAPETYGYVYGNYLELFETPTDAEDHTVMDHSEITESSITEITESSHGLTPEGNMTLVDDIGSLTQAGQQFITMVTKNGNYFYLIIDRDDKGSENVHFLSLVDERELLSLLSNEEVKDYETEKAEIQAAKVTEPEPDEITAEEEKEPEIKKQSHILPLIFIVIIVIIIGAFFILKKLKPKNKKKERPDPDMDYEAEEEDDAYILPEGEYENEEVLDKEDYPPDDEED